MVHRGGFSADPNGWEGREPQLTVQVTAPARLHLGFLDLAGDLGRRFGSLGLTLDGLATRIRVRPAERLRVSGPSSDRARRYAKRLLTAWGLPHGLELALDEALPEHVGLGSGTQLGLAVGAGIAASFGREVRPRAIASETQRGARSGIGLGAFEQGGLLLDGGQGTGESPPPIVARLPFPEDWRVLVILDRARRGVHGEAEVQAFEALPPFPAESTGHLCRLVLMRLLPAVAEGDIALAGQAIGELQCVVGDHFAPVQGGRYASPEVARVLAWLKGEGFEGVGQSSWGPTGFALIGDSAAAGHVLGLAERRFGADGRLRFVLCRGRNSGAEVVAEPALSVRASASPGQL